MIIDPRTIDVSSRAADADFDIWLQKNLELIRELFSVPAWSAPTLLAGWTNVGGANDEIAGYRVTGTRQLHLRGYLVAGMLTDGTVIMQLPENARPNVHARIGNLEIRSDGDVAIYGASSPLSIHATINLNN